MTLLVVEEEKDIIREIRGILDTIDRSIRVVGVTNDIVSVPAWIKKNNIPDLILVSEEVVADLNLYHRRAKAVVTFSTDADAYQYQAFRFNTLRQILDKLPGTGNLPIPSLPVLHNGDKEISASHYRERFLVKQGQRLHSIHINEIAYFFSEERFIFFKTFDDQKYVTEYRIERLETMLNPERFFRINRSYIISLTSVRQIHSWFGSRLKLYLHPEAEREILVSRERVKKFKSWLGK